MENPQRGAAVILCKRKKVSNSSKMTVLISCEKDNQGKDVSICPILTGLPLLKFVQKIVKNGEDRLPTAATLYI